MAVVVAVQHEILQKSISILLWNTYIPREEKLITFAMLPSPVLAPIFEEKTSLQVKAQLKKKLLLWSMPKLNGSKLNQAPGSMYIALTTIEKSLFLTGLMLCVRAPPERACSTDDGGVVATGKQTAPHRLIICLFFVAKLNLIELNIVDYRLLPIATCSVLAVASENTCQTT